MLQSGLAFRAFSEVPLCVWRVISRPTIAFQPNVGSSVCTGQLQKLRAGPSALAIDREGCSELREGRRVPPHFVLHTRPSLHAFPLNPQSQASAGRKTPRADNAARDPRSVYYLFQPPILHSLALVTFPLFHSRPSLKGLKRCFRLPPFFASPARLDGLASQRRFPVLCSRTPRPVILDLSLSYTSASRYTRLHLSAAQHGRVWQGCQVLPARQGR